MTSRLAILKAGAAVAALAFVLPAPAHAFEDVDWDWEKNIVEDWDIDIRINETFVIDDMVQIEKLQWFIGDVNAYATIDNIYNQPGTDGELPDSVSFEATFSDTADYDDAEVAEDAVNPVENTPQDFEQLTGPEGVDLVLTDGNTDEQADEIDLNFTVTGEIDLEDLDLVPLDAADLPKVENIAVAVGNNQIIESSSPLFLHDGQFVHGGPTGGDDSEQFSFDFVEEDGNPDNANLHTQLALDLADEALDGDISKAQITATAIVGDPGCGENCAGEVWDILNASVENSATAVANNASFTLFADGTDDTGLSGNTMVADLTQFAYADVTATAQVYDVLIDGYAGFGDACFGGGCEEITPIVSNVATAVGNNLNISVGVEGFDTE